MTQWCYKTHREDSRTVPKSMPYQHLNCCVGIERKPISQCYAGSCGQIRGCCRLLCLSGDDTDRSVRQMMMLSSLSARYWYWPLCPPGDETDRSILQLVYFALQVVVLPVAALKFVDSIHQTSSAVNICPNWGRGVLEAKLCCRTNLMKTREQQRGTLCLAL